MILEKSYVCDYKNSKARPENIVVCGNTRFTVIADRLLRIEYSPDAKFTDLPTLCVVERDFEKPQFIAKMKNEGCSIVTDYFELTFTGGAITSKSLRVRSGKKGHFNEWFYGSANSLSLPGTVRTLDEVNGEIPLGKSFLNPKEVEVLDDSNTPVIAHSGMPQERCQGVIDLYLFMYERDYVKAVRDYTVLTGRVGLLPRFVFGNWWSRFYEYTEESYNALMDKFDSEGVPLSVAVIDMDWHDVKNVNPKYGTGWTGYSWNKEWFPNPKRFLKGLHKRGLKTTLNLHPHEGVSAHEECYKDFGEYMGVDIEKEENIKFDIADSKFINGYFKYCLHPLEKEGVDFWWMDWQQGTDTEIKNLDPLWMLNHMHYLDSARSGKRPLIFSRYAGVGSQRYPIGFSGDTYITWDSLNFQPYFTSSASNVGYGWWSHDIGGHMRGYYDSELTTRWIQYGVFSPINRLHSAKTDFVVKEPWNFDIREHSIMVNFLRLRHKLVPYIYTMNYRQATKQIPMITPTFYYTEKEYSNRNQYMFGDSLLVAPITKPESKIVHMSHTKVFLPHGIWYDFFTGDKYVGDREYDVYRKLEDMPVFAREGSIIPLSKEVSNDLSNPAALEVLVFAGKHGEFKLYEDDGISKEYQKGVYAFTNFALNNKTFTIGKVEGDTSVVPKKRVYCIRFKNVINDKYVSYVNGKAAKVNSYTDGKDFIIEVCLTPDDEFEITFDKALKTNDIDYKKAMFNILLRAGVEFDWKIAMQNKIDSSANAGNMLTDVLSTDMDEQLKSALAEPLLMLID